MVGACLQANFHAKFYIENTMPVLNLLTLKHALTLGANELKASDTPALDCELILLFTINAHRNVLFTDPEKLLNKAQQKTFINLIARRLKGEPVAYIIGSQGFWNLDLKVSPDTLIPRADTESLVEWVLEQDINPKRILDLGTGTGALALALASELPEAEVLGLDLVEKAVALAEENRQRNNINNASFIRSSWFERVGKEQSFDLIVSNPPYIDDQDIHLGQGDVRFEPISALVAKDKGFADLFLIAEQAKQYLSDGGVLVMEHGWQQASDVQNRLTELGYEGVGSGKDYGGNQRFTFGFLNT
jgi:release factor glutamine methyltransferase